MSVVTRFAPAPTGSLHLGGARTALFNWLFAKSHQGAFLLRLEDTDKQRSSDVIAESIMSDLSWLGLGHDGKVVIQSERVERHVEVAHQLIKLGKAYRCYCSDEEINTQRAESESMGQPYKHICPWKDKGKAPTPDAPGVIRLISPDNTTLEFVDGVYGKIAVSSDQIGDMVILRSDGTPTYLLAVVVDDHDMGVTDIIRGSDHIANTPKQILLAAAMGWDSPRFYHIPLIHDENGAKLSKRNRAPGIHEYKELGFLPEALCNYLLRMGWSHKNKEIVPIEEAIEIFSMNDVGVSCACLNYKKLLFLNHHYMCQKSESDIIALVSPILEKELGSSISQEKYLRLSLGIKKITERAKTLNDIARDALFYVQDAPIQTDQEATAVINGDQELLAALVAFAQNIPQDIWERNSISTQIKELSKVKSIEMHHIYTMLRASIVGRIQSPNISEVMEILGKAECLDRMEHHLNKN